MKRGIGLGIIIFTSFMLSGCRQPDPFVDQRFVMDTLVTIKIYEDAAAKETRAGSQAAFERIALVEKRLNIFDKRSEAANVNRAAGRLRAVKASPDLWTAVSEGEGIKRLTRGAFDPAIGRITSLWRFGDKPRLPKADEIRRAVETARGERVVLDEDDRTVYLDTKGMKLDLGGIAKGIAVDRAARALERRGLKSAVITAVSSVKVIGEKPGGGPWRIGIQAPRAKEDSKEGSKLLGFVDLRRGSISTTGEYQQFFVRNGRRYHHILDPKTGMPARGFRSVTVVTTKSAAYADALSTGLAVMGRRRAMALVEKLPGVEAVFVDGRGKLWISSGLRDDFTRAQSGQE